MNDRVAEARMARLARLASSTSPEGDVMVERGRVAQTSRVAPGLASSVAHSRAGLARLAAALLEAAALIGQSISPAPPLRVRAIRR